MTMEIPWVSLGNDPEDPSFVDGARCLVRLEGSLFEGCSEQFRFRSWPLDIEFESIWFGSPMNMGSSALKRVIPSHPPDIKQMNK
jgi:hypothetical protein